MNLERTTLSFRFHEKQRWNSDLCVSNVHFCLHQGHFRATLISRVPCARHTCTVSDSSRSIAALQHPHACATTRYCHIQQVSRMYRGSSLAAHLTRFVGISWSTVIWDMLICVCCWSTSSPPQRHLQHQAGRHCSLMSFVEEKTRHARATLVLTFAGWRSCCHKASLASVQNSICACGVTCVDENVSGLAWFQICVTNGTSERKPARDVPRSNKSINEATSDIPNQ